MKVGLLECRSSAVRIERKYRAEVLEVMQVAAVPCASQSSDHANRADRRSLMLAT